MAADNENEISGNEFEPIKEPNKPWYLLEDEDYDLWEGFEGLVDERKPG